MTIGPFDPVHSVNHQEKKLSCHRHRAMFRVIEYNVTQNHSRSFEMTPFSRACVHPYQLSFLYERSYHQSFTQTMRRHVNRTQQTSSGAPQHGATTWRI